MPKLRYSTLGLVANTTKPAVRALKPLLARVFASLNVRAYGLKGQSHAFKIKPLSPQALSSKCDLILSLGGDGTMLEAARIAATGDIPVLGVNLGLLGFITPVPAENIEEGLTAALLGRYRVEPRAMLQAEIIRGGRKVYSRSALNDMVLLRGATGKLALLETHINGRYLASFRADGLIVSTPTGSTAYSLASGGPVVEPRSRNFLLAPISPHTLSVRPLVLSDSSVLDIQMPASRAPLHFSTDGEKGFWLKLGDRIRVGRCGRDAKLLVPKDYDYWDVLRRKLGWRGS